MLLEVDVITGNVVGLPEHNYITLREERSSQTVKVTTDSPGFMFEVRQGSDFNVVIETSPTSKIN